MKNTKARCQILDIIQKSQTPLTAEEIYSNCSAGVNMSTIYRNLASYVQNGIINKEFNAQRIAIYSIIKPHHQHLLECLECHKKVELHECPFEKANKKLQKETGFVINNENTVIYGICKNCKNK